MVEPAHLLSLPWYRGWDALVQLAAATPPYQPVQQAAHRWLQEAGLQDRVEAGQGEAQEIGPTLVTDQKQEARGEAGQETPGYLLLSARPIQQPLQQAGCVELPHSPGCRYLAVNSPGPPSSLPDILAQFPHSMEILAGPASHTQHVRYLASWVRRGKY